ncbi:hypothetical protein LCGC14_2750230, partial [marine sediment metagenome]
MTDQTATEPVADAPEPAPEPEVTPEVEAAEPVEPEGDEPTPEPEAPEPDQPVVQPDPLDELAALADALPEQDTVEVEVNGLKFRVPAAVGKDGYMKDADYTRKSQENADVARTLESDREAFKQQVQNQGQHIADLGELSHTDKLLEDFRQVDFQQLQQEDPDQAQQLHFRFQKLRDTREQIVGRIQKREYDSRVQAERETADRKNRLTATLARDIPNYSPTKHTQMEELAVSFGIKPEALAAYAEGPHYQILDLALLGAEVLKRKRVATAQPAPKPVKPVPKATGGGTPATGPSDKQGVDAWMRSRKQQL